MGILRGDKGVALVTALMLTMLALVISMALLYSVTTGTKISASQKRYRSALAAAYGGTEFLTQEIIPKLFQADTTQPRLLSDFSSIDLGLPQYACLQEKLTSPTSQWSNPLSACSGVDLSADSALSPDVTFRLSGDRPGNASFSVSTKIIDAVPGNTDRTSGDFLDPGSAVSGTQDVIHPQHVPGIYNISVQGARDGASGREKARLSVLYAY